MHPQKGGKYLLLDGHMRLLVLRDLEKEEVLCIVSSDDESYTSNTKVSRLVPIQANRMILKALDAGVPEERLARAINLNPNTIHSSRSLLADVCPEAIESWPPQQAVAPRSRRSSASTSDGCTPSPSGCW